MADRFCGNCGNELRPNDRFCANCGRPVHETAEVPTPEADVPTPPPPQDFWERLGTWFAAPDRPPPGRYTRGEPDFLERFGTWLVGPDRPPPQQATRGEPVQPRPRPFLYQRVLNVGCAVILFLVMVVVLVVFILLVTGGSA